MSDITIKRSAYHWSTKAHAVIWREPQGTNVWHAEIGGRTAQNPRWEEQDAVDWAYEFGGAETHEIIVWARGATE